MIFFKKSFYYFDVEGDDFREVSESVAEMLKAQKLIEDSYLEALLEREREFPTGLITKQLNIALPHTDPEHIKQPFVYVVKSKKSVLMKQMGDNQEITVKNFLFLGITNPNEQIKVLQTIMNLFMDDNFVPLFISCTDEVECFELFKDKLDLKS